MTNFNFENIPEEVVKAYRPFAENLVSMLAESLLSISVTGSCLSGDYIHGISDINSVLVLKETGMPQLDALTALSTFRKKKVKNPLIMSEEYIARSHDVFPIEFLDMKLLHKTIYGKDFFEKITIEKESLRLQCERDLKGKLIHLQRGYVACRNKPALLKDLMLEAIPGFFPLLRAMLFLIQADKGIPLLKKDVVSAAQSACNIDMKVFEGIMSLRTTSRFSIERGYILNLFKELYRITYELSLTSDTLNV